MVSVPDVSEAYLTAARACIIMATVTGQRFSCSGCLLGHDKLPVAGTGKAVIARTGQSMSLFAKVIKSCGVHREGGISPQGMRITK